MRGKVKFKTVDAYLASVPADQRAALEKLRVQIKAAAPDAEEYITYNIPAVRLNGRMLVAYGAGANHCAFYPGAHPIAAHAAALKSYDTAKGTVRFTVARPLPATLVQQMVETRIAEYAQIAKLKKSKSAQ